MKWTALLNGAIDANYRTADGLMAMVGDADLGWKPATGSNWMTTGQLLMHLTTACGFCCSIQLNISASTSHICCHSNAPSLTCGGNNFCFKFVVPGI